MSEHAEQTLIAAVSSHPNRQESQDALLELSHEYFEGHAESLIWQAMRDLCLNGLAINETGIRQQLATLGHLGPNAQYWATFKSLLVRSDEPVEPLAQEVKDEWIRRNLAEILDSHRAELVDPANGASDTANKIQEAVAELVAGGAKDGDPWDDIAKKIERGEGMSDLVRQGGYFFDAFDAIYKIPRGAVTFVVARLNTGKTLAGLTIARQTVFRGEKVLWVNQDMPAEMMKLKIISCFSGVPQWKIEKGCMNNGEKALVENVMPLLREKVSFMHYPGMTPLSTMKPKVIASIRRNKPSLVVWDQFSQIGKEKGTGKRDDVQAAFISRSIKNLAGTCDVAVVMLAQANRGASQGEPSLLDIAETDAIGQDACGVITLWPNEDRMKQAQDSGQIDFGIVTTEKWKNVPTIDIRLAKSQISQAGDVFHLWRDGERNQFVTHELRT